MHVWKCKRWSSIPLQRKSAILNGSRERERAQQTWPFNDKQRTNFRLPIFLLSCPFSFLWKFCLSMLLLLRHTNYTLEFFGCCIKEEDEERKSIENKTLGNKFDFSVNQHDTPCSLVIFLFIIPFYFLYLSSLNDIFLSWCPYIRSM